MSPSVDLGTTALASCVILRHLASCQAGYLQGPVGPRHEARPRASVLSSGIRQNLHLVNLACRRGEGFYHFLQEHSVPSANEGPNLRQPIQSTKWFAEGPAHTEMISLAYSGRFHREDSTCLLSAYR